MRLPIRHAPRRAAFSALALAFVVAPLIKDSAVLANPLLCHHARPVVNKPGFRPYARIPSSFGRSPNGTPFPARVIPCVTQAFDAWTRANERAGLHVQFVRGTGGIVVRMDNPGGLALQRKRGGGWADGVRSPDGYLEGALIWLTADPKMVDSCDGFTKVMIHEPRSPSRPRRQTRGSAGPRS